MPISSSFLDFLIGLTAIGLTMLVWPNGLKAQDKNKVLVIEGTDYFERNNVFELADSLQLVRKLQEERSKLLSQGYLTAGVDSLVNAGKDTTIAYFYRGKLFKWGQLKEGNVPEEYLTKSGYRDKVYFGEPMRTREITKLLNSILDQSENTGYPFAEIFLDSIAIEKDEVSAILHYRKNDFVKLDSLIIKGALKTNRSFIENHIGFRKGLPYNQKQLRRIPNRLNEIPFVQQIKPYEVGMRPGKADIYLYLNEKKASNFDGILGVLSDPETGEIIFTGDVKLNLVNALNRGETINLRWQRLRTQTQQLDLKFRYPYIFKTPLGIDFSLNLYRRDTTFSQNNVKGGLEYYFDGSNTVRIYFQNLGANTIGENIGSDLADSRTNLVGLGTEIYELDYRFNARRGFFIEADVAAGEKEILSLSEDSELDAKSEIYNINLNAGYFVPLFKRSTLHFRVQAGHFENENMFRNEIYRIGGLQTLRGFDEQAIFATSFLIGTIEYRFILEQNSNIFLFLDQAYYEDTAREEPLIDSPFGFGAGVNFETGAGIFSLTYALGQQFDNTISLRGGKVHFGFTGFF